MKNKSKIDIFWGASLIVIFLATFTMNFPRLMGAVPPDALIIAMGILDLIALPVLVFTTVRKLMKKQDKKTEETK